jgi:hypothetical protein
MSPSNFAILALRLLGIYFFVESVPLFSAAALEAAFAEKISETPGAPQIPGFSGSAVFLAFTPAVSLLVLGLLMFLFAVPLARRLSPPVSDEVKKNTWSFEDIQAIIFAAVGILILSDALPGVGRALVNLYSWYGFPQADGAVVSARLRGDWMYSAGVIAQMIIGLVMVLSPKGFRNLWRWLRTAGTRPRLDSGA